MIRLIHEFQIISVCILEDMIFFRVVLFSQIEFGGSRRESGAAAAKPRSSWDSRDTTAAVLAT